MIFGRKREPLEAYNKILIMGWIVYFIDYLGRYNYSAAMISIGKAEGYSPAQLGAVVSILFITYGAGQLISGVLGDIINPVFLITTGITGTGICNMIMAFAQDPLMMKIVWGVNGICCALLWAPLLKMLIICIPPEKLRGAIISIQYATAAGTCFTYLFTSAVLSFMPWRYVFILSSVLILAAAVGWIITSIITNGKYEKQNPQQSIKAEDNSKSTFFSIYISSGFILLLVVIMVMGIMKDGIMTWVPKVITDTFGTSASLSLFLSAALPLVNLLGIRAVKVMSKKIQNNDVLMSLLLYIAAFVLMCILSLTANIHPLWTIIIFSMVSACIFGINTVLISFLSLRFATFGRSATVAGITNAATYAGSALSGWGLGFIAEQYGWSKVNWILVGLCIICIVLCSLILPLWNRFLKRSESIDI